MKLVIITDKSEVDIVKKTQEAAEKVKKHKRLRHARAKLKNFVRKHL